MTSSSSLSFPIEKFFPKDEYAKKCKENASLTTNYLIALGQPSKNFLPLILKKGVNFQDTEWGFTALHVATLVGNHDLMQVMIKMKADLEAEDCGGLLPLHYACALRDIKAMTILQEAMKAKTISTNIFDIYPKWKPLLEPQFSKDEEYVIYWKEENSKAPVQVTAKSFLEKTDARYYNGVISSYENFILLLAERVKQKLALFSNDYGILTKELTRQFSEIEEGRATFPSIYVGYQKGAGNGAFAGTFIPAGQICVVYGGEVIFNRDGSDYSLGSTEALQIRNAGPFVNDGFPNAAYFSLTLSDGRRIPLIFALRDLQQDEPIFTDYHSTHKVKFLRHFELNLNEMEECFKKKDPVTLWKEFSLLQKKNNSDFKTVLKKENLKSQLEYLIHTPSALFTLYLKGIVTGEHIQKLMNDTLFLERLNTSNDSVFLQTFDFSLETIKTIDQLMQSATPTLCAEFKEFCLEIVANHTFQVLNQVVTYISNKKLSLSNWQQQKENFKAFTDAMQSIMSVFLPPITEKATDADLKQFGRKINGLPPEMKTNILQVLIHAVDNFSPHLKEDKDKLLKVCLLDLK